MSFFTLSAFQLVYLANAVIESDLLNASEPDRLFYVIANGMDVTIKAVPDD